MMTCAAAPPPLLLPLPNTGIMPFVCLQLMWDPDMMDSCGIAPIDDIVLPVSGRGDWEQDCRGAAGVREAGSRPAVPRLACPPRLTALLIAHHLQATAGSSHAAATQACFPMHASKLPRLPCPPLLPPPCHAPLQISALPPLPPPPPPPCLPAQLVETAYSGKYGGCAITGYTITRVCVGQGSAKGSEWQSGGLCVDRFPVVRQRQM